MREVRINIEGMHCASCGLLIDDVLLDLPGVQSSITDTRSGICSVSADDSVDDATLLAGVIEAGYRGSLA
mgnify:CR=1 FL=1